MFWCIKEANEESALWVRTTSKTPLFPSVVSALIHRHKCDSQQMQRMAPSGCWQPAGLPAKLLPGEEASLQAFSSMHPAPVSSVVAIQLHECKKEVPLKRKDGPHAPSPLWEFGVREKSAYLLTPILNLLCRKHEVKMGLVGNVHSGKWKQGPGRAQPNG